jgi:hypothetical protein
MGHRSRPDPFLDDRVIRVCPARVIRKVLINLRASSVGQGPTSRIAMRTVDFAVRSYLVILTAGYVVLCTVLVSLVVH